MREFPKQVSGRLTVDLGAIRENYDRLARQAGSAECAAVVKADAYGLGMEEVVSTLAADVGTFFVAQPEEGCQLRTLQPGKRIFVLHGFLPGKPEVMAEHALIPVINTLEQLRDWLAFCQKEGRNYPAALQFDTGMSRFGLSQEELHDEMISQFRPVLVMSHLACADKPDDLANEAQRQRFLAMSALFPGVPRSLAASSGIYLGKDYHFDLVRPGIGLYGLPPNDGESPFVPTVTLEAQILQRRRIQAGDRIGYGLAYRAQHPMDVATVGMGYADGLFRAFSGKGALWKDGIRLPVLGRVSMDSLSVDVSALPEPLGQEGEWLSVIGPEQDIATIADATGTIGYEVLTALGGRFSRFYKG